jgi:hypothetical protein
VLQQMVNKDWCQVLQDGSHGDKFTINADLAKVSILAAQDMRGEPVTAEQVQKLIGGEDVCTRGMQQLASDVQWRAPIIFLANIMPPWADPSGALMNRLVIFTWKELETTADAGLLDKMTDPKQLAAATLCMLKAYGNLRAHIQQTPAQDWSYQYITDAIREETTRKQPFAAFLSCGEFDDGTDTFKLEYSTDDSAKLVKIQAAYDIYCATVLKISKQTLTFKEWREQLKMASNLLDGDKAYVLLYKKDIYLCKECGENNTLNVTGASTCKPTCSIQCPPNAHLVPHAADYLRCRVPKIKKTSKKRDHPIVLNLNLTRTNTIGSFFSGGAVAGGSAV